jgi:cytochrome c biogenesis protein
MAETAISPNQSQQRSALERYVDRVWRFFTSVRNAIYEIAFLTLLVLIGTLRGSAAPQWMADNLPFLQPLVDRWYAWDVFRSPIFAATLAIIAIAIIICTLNRVPQIWATFAHPKIRTTTGFINGADTAATYTLPNATDDTLAKLREVLARRRYRTLTEKVGDETHIYADKNRFSGFGTFPFHIGLILLLVGGIVASSLGFRDNEFVISEGYRQNVGHGTGLSVELVRVRDTWNAQGSPIDYTSEIRVYENGEPVKIGDVKVNHPVSYGPATFYQSSFGTTGEFTVRDAAGNIVFSGPVELGLFTARANPDAPAGFINIPTENLRISVIAPDSNGPNLPELDDLKLAPGQMWVGMPGDAEGMVVQQGQPTRIGDYTLTFEREGRYTVLQVGYNPGIPIFIIAALFMLGGLMVTFYFPHRRIRAILRPTGSGSELALAPLAKRDYSGKREFYDILSKLNESTATTPTVRAPRNKGDFEYLYKHSHAVNESR